MKSGWIKSRKSEDAGEAFRFFPPRERDMLHEGREPHEAVKTDWMGDQFPRPWHISVLLFVMALGVYLATLSWTPFPGQPVRMLMMHLKMEPTLSMVHSLWGWGVRGAGRLPGLPVAGWMGLFSAVCGAACVALLGRLMTRVAFLVRNEPGPESLLREAQARRLSSLVAGLYLTFSMPFWVASTRSLPESFHLLGLLVTVTWFSDYQHWGRRRYLFLMGLAYGVGLTESTTFLVFLPVSVLLLAHEMFRWQALRDWRTHLALWTGLGLGLSVYGFNAFMLYRQGLPLDLAASPAEVLIRIWKDQFRLAFLIRYSPGFLVAMFFCLAPWLTLFVMSRRSPWFYESGQVAVRILFAAGLLAALFNLSFAPWALMGMQFMAVMPYVLMAVCMGYMAGEFWIMGEEHLLLDFRIRKRLARWASSAFACLLPVAIAAGGLYNWRKADGTPGRILHEAAVDILDELDGPFIILSAGALDDALRMAVRDRWAPVVLISAPRTSSPVYLRRLADSFQHELLRGPLSRGNFIEFIDNLMMSEEGPSRTVIIDLPDKFREYGYLMPSGFFYRLQPESPTAEELSAHAQAQWPFWERMVQLRDQLPPDGNPARVYLDYLGLMISRVVNNLGVMQADRGDETGARETFRMAWRIFPDNASALLNLLGLACRQDLPEAEGLEAEWMDRLLTLKGNRWGMAAAFGHVWNARQWLERGWVWALSGVPDVSGDSSGPPLPPDAAADEINGILNKAYLTWKEEVEEESRIFGHLRSDMRDTGALMELARLALRRGDLEVAGAYMDHALEMGLPEEKLQFDRAMAAVVRGNRDEAVEILDHLTHVTPGDTRIWAALAVLTGEEDPRNRQAIWTLRNHHGDRGDVRRVLASILMERGQWVAARVELERAVEADERSTQAWEMLMTVANELRNHRLMKAAEQALIARDPSHFIQFQNIGIAHYEKGELPEAEEAFREGIRRRRDPTLLNNLAHVILQREGNLQEALMLVNEAMRRQPGIPSMYNTRAEIYMKMGRLSDARRDVLDALRRRGRGMDPLLNLAEGYLDAGDGKQSAALLRVAEALRERLDPVQAQRLDALQARRRLRAGSSRP